MSLLGWLRRSDSFCGILTPKQKRNRQVRQTIKWALRYRVDPPEWLWGPYFGWEYCWQCERYFHGKYRPHPGYKYPNPYA